MFGLKSLNLLCTRTLSRVSEACGIGQNWERVHSFSILSDAVHSGLFQADLHSVACLTALSRLAHSNSHLQWKVSFPILKCPWISPPCTWFWVLFRWADQSVVDWWACGLNLNSAWTLVFWNLVWLRGSLSAIGSSWCYIYLWASKVFGRFHFLVD